MNIITIYGIKNCDTMKKAFRWLENNDLDYTFHDYKKQGIDESTILEAIKQCGWENVINRRGTTWRNLPEGIKSTINDEQALKVAQDNPSIVKRPLLNYEDKIYLGFKDTQYAEIFKR